MLWFFEIMFHFVKKHVKKNYQPPLLTRSYELGFTKPILISTSVYK